jgi:hypothetical protein
VLSIKIKVNTKNISHRSMKLNDKIINIIYLILIFKADFIMRIEILKKINVKGHGGI